MSRGSPSSGSPHVISISSSAVTITQLWYTIPNKNDPPVATIRSFGSVVSLPVGVAIVGMLPTKHWTYFGSACMELPMPDVYALSGVGCSSTYCFTSS
jgi:hypothetical protein